MSAISSWGIHIWNFQNPSMHISKLMLCIKTLQCKMPKMTKGHNLRSIFFRIYSKVNGVIDSLLPILRSSNFKALASIVFEIFFWQDFIHFLKCHNSGKGHNSDKKKIYVNYFIMRSPYTCMKFQNLSMQGSEVMLCIKKRNARTHERARSNMYLQLLQY